MLPSLLELNALPPAEFVSRLENLYESSPWVVRAVVERRPFSSAEGLKEALRQAVEAAPEPDQLALIRAHPDLAGRLAEQGQVTAESAHEQKAAGLLSLSTDERLAMTRSNEAYRQKFGFPFVVCARQHTPESITAAMAVRLQNDIVTEQAAALREIHQIAALRLEDLICPEN